MSTTAETDGLIKGLAHVVKDQQNPQNEFAKATVEQIAQLTSTVA